MKNSIKIIFNSQIARILVAAALTAHVWAGDEIPFKGNLTGDFTVEPLEPPFGLVTIEGTGNATHLGRFTVDIPHVVNFETSTGIGTFEFQAANGDTLLAEFNGEATPTESEGVVSIVENARITGGTGRFKGATGTFVAIRLANLITGFTTGLFQGVIILPKRKP